MVVFMVLKQYHPFCILCSLDILVYRLLCWPVVFISSSNFDCYLLGNRLTTSVVSCDKLGA